MMFFDENPDEAFDRREEMRTAYAEQQFLGMTRAMRRAALQLMYDGGLSFAEAVAIVRGIYGR